ncbi:MAG: hypothetical protein WBR13_09395 [Allosphingosinicella sp.]
MNKLIIALAATTAFAGAAPAAAQYAGSSFQPRIGELQTQLQAGVRSGGITRAEAVPLRQQLRQLTDLERRYASGGFSAGERNDLQSRMASLRHSIRMAARSGNDRYGNDGRDGRWQDRDGRWHDGDGRNDDARPCPPGLARKNNGCLPPGQVGRDDRDDRYDRDDDRYDRDDDRWDDRDYDRDDRRDNDDDYRQNDGRGVVGQIMDRVTGNDGLRVGQRASSNLGGVPSAYRSRYRDGNGVYYRSDGRNIYQIDARTQTVARIYPMTR